jgi:hypothetical protein
MNAVCGSLLIASVLAQTPDPSTVVNRAITQLVQQPLTSAFWGWAYGPAIQMSAMYDVSKFLRFFVYTGNGVFSQQ